MYKLLLLLYLWLMDLQQKECYKNKKKSPKYTYITLSLQAYFIKRESKDTFTHTNIL